MKRVVGLSVVVYLLGAVIGSVASADGLVSCGCAEGCWCHRPGWGSSAGVPMGHAFAWTAGHKGVV